MVRESTVRETESTVRETESTVRETENMVRENQRISMRIDVEVLSSFDLIIICFLPLASNQETTSATAW